jgi:hypothetical protein
MNDILKQKIIDKINEMLNFDPGNCRGDIYCQTESRLVIFIEGCEEILIELKKDNHE